MTAMLAMTLWSAAGGAVANKTIAVDHGVLRWSDGSEVALFGTNYYPPFCIDYRQLKRMGANIHAEIDASTAHFVRLGLGGLRLHCFDREISDGQGNLIDNEHLDLLDYLIYRCKQRGLYLTLTPIAWWPCPEKTHGFSDRFPMQQMTTNPEAWACESRYLVQFLDHINRYTHLAYKNDPAIAALECINEPIYPTGTTDAQVTKYIDTLVDAIHSTGCRKPVFFNAWGGRGKAVADSRADGASNSWYPSGLMAGHSLWANFLPKIAHYGGFDDPALADKPKMLYEFDAADIPGAYMYPAMARDFREAGAQIANQFQYDCLALASTNIDWQTHYNNLVYAPAKAISFAIAARAFRDIPRGKSFGDYPASDHFGPFGVDWRTGQSEMVGERTFMYSGPTSSRPPDPDRLEDVAGVGTSLLVHYDGTGAYFLDRLGEGAWRLELYPDAVWIADPYGAPSASRTVSRLVWRAREMALRLPGLGADFTARRLAPEAEPAVAAADASQTARDGQFTVAPGVWVLTPKGAAAPDLGKVEFYCPAPKPGAQVEPAAWVMAPSVWRAGQALPLWVNAATATGEPRAAQAWVLGDSDGAGAGRGRVERVDLRRAGPYHFEGRIPAADLRGKHLRYMVALDDGHGWLSLPSRLRMRPEDATRQAARRIPLWQAAGSTAPPFKLTGAASGTGEAKIVDGAHGPALRVEVTKFDPQDGVGSLELPVEPVAKAPGMGWSLCVEGRALYPQTTGVEVSLRQSDGAALGRVVPMSTAWQVYRVPLDSLGLMWNTSGSLHVTKAQQIVLVFGTWLYHSASVMPHGFEIGRVYLAPSADYEATLLPATGALPIVGAPGVALPSTGTGVQAAVSVVEGSKAGTRALRFTGGPFGPPPDCVAKRYEMTSQLPPRMGVSWQPMLKGCRDLVFTARADTPDTTQVEVVFIEDDGSPWGMNLPLTAKWKTTRVPVSKLRFWTNWTKPGKRGFPGDHFRPGHLATVQLCFGSWLYPKHAAEVHSFDIQEIGMEK